MNRGFAVFLAAVLMFGLAAPLAAQGRSVGFGVGYVSPEDLDGALWFSANALFGVHEKVLLEPEIGFWSKSAKAGYQGTTVAEATIRDLSFALHAHYLLVEKPRITLGAGPGIHSISGETEYYGYSAEGDETKVGVHFLGGAEFPVSDRAALNLGIRYDVVEDLNQIKGVIGVRFGF